MNPNPNQPHADAAPTTVRPALSIKSAESATAAFFAAETTASALDDGRHDFDFYFGRWSIRNERLKERLIGSKEWETFEAKQECRPILGGLGNLDEFASDWNRADADGAFLGMTLRLFDPRTRRWSIYWASNRGGVLEPPVIGAFENGVGTFYGHDRHQGIPVRVRFIWSDITATGALWQQAFSTDEGKSWETNWIMRMTRLSS